jgi:ribosome recycling factor
MATSASQAIKEADGRMRRALEAVRSELAGIRTGRASPGLVEHLRVDYHGVPTPLIQLATITAPEVRLLVIQPWERAALSIIEKAIQRSDIGINPSNDGHSIRLVLPQLTEERRRELVRLVRKRVEEGKVVLRNIRRDALEEVRAMEKRKELPEDERRRATEQLQKVTDGFMAQAEALEKAKEAELMEI